MKCEICHERDAETAIQIERNGEEDELYVCRQCAKADRLRRQKKSQRTRKVMGLPPGMEMSVTEVSSSEDGDEPPPIISAIVDAFQGMVSDIEKAHEEGKRKAAAEEPVKELAPSGDSQYRLRGRLHLEGLYLIGEIEAVRRAFAALGLELTGLSPDGLRDAGHVYGIGYRGSDACAKRVEKDLLREERNARVRLFEEMPRVFCDSLGRALAILKNCRLLSPGEYFDLLSPLMLAAKEDLLDGVTFEELAETAEKLDLSSAEDRLEPAARDEADARRADAANERFEDVVLNERAEGMLQ